MTSGGGGGRHPDERGPEDRDDRPGAAPGGPGGSGQPGPYGPPGASGPYGPYSWPDPYGPHGPQHGYGYGHAPAPQAWQGPPPEPRERPLTVRAGLGALVAWIVLGVATPLVLFTGTDDLVDQFSADPAFQDVEGTGVDAAAFFDALLPVLIGFFLLVAALELMFVWFAWRGRNWARIVLFVLGGMGILSGLFGLTAFAVQPAQAVLSLFQFGAVLVGVVLLALRPSSEWYRYETWRRKVGG